LQAAIMTTLGIDVVHQNQGELFVARPAAPFFGFCCCRFVNGPMVLISAQLMSDDFSAQKNLS
jgi:hypothetical protein